MPTNPGLFHPLPAYPIIAGSGYPGLFPNLPVRNCGRGEVCRWINATLILMILMDLFGWKCRINMIFGLGNVGYIG